MERLKAVIGRRISLDCIKDRKALADFGIECSYLPDPPDIFDEFEFRMEWTGGRVSFLVAVEQDRVQRLLFGQVDEEDPDLFRPLPEETLSHFISEKGDELCAFFDHICPVT